jgi:predicted nucleic acid-binding protein
LIVLDGSAAVHYLVGGEAAAWVKERLLAEPDVHAPHLLDVEVANALRRLVRLGRLTARAAHAGLADLVDLDVVRYPHTMLLARVWSLRANLNAYDASYVALAEILDATLVTADARLARAPGVRARVEAYPDV